MQRLKWYIGICTFMWLSLMPTVITCTSKHTTQLLPGALHSSNAKHALNDSIMGKIGASVMGESALIDKESGRIFWEGGSTSTIHASIAPFLGDLGLRHLKGTALSVLLWLSILSLLARYLRGIVARWSATEPKIPWPLMIGLFIMKCTILRVPKFGTWFMIVISTLYLLEASTCNTRRYLTNAISSPKGVEEYIERLRKEQPTVTWKVRCFHYERTWLAFLLAPQLLFRTYGDNNNNDDHLGLAIAPSAFLTKKVVTHCAQDNYKYNHCQDSTIAGVWKRAAMSTASPFTKISLTKLLVLPNTKARIDYFQQQSTFVTTQGQEDEYAEFSTNISVPGFKSRMLAVRTMEGIPSAKLFRLHMFWVFTCLGLSVPFRVWFARHCDMLRVTVVKETSSEGKSATSASKSSTSSWFKWNKALSTMDNSTTTTESSFRKLMQDLSLYDNSEDNEAILNLQESCLLESVSNETSEPIVIAGDAEDAGDIGNENNTTNIDPNEEKTSEEINP